MKLSAYVWCYVTYRSKTSSSPSFWNWRERKRGCIVLLLVFWITPINQEFEKSDSHVDEGWTHHTMTISTRGQLYRMHRYYPAPQIQPVWFVNMRRSFTLTKTTYLSFVTPSTKHMTQGNTLIDSFSTSQGIFSTKTRRKRVLKYLGANFCPIREIE